MKILIVYTSKTGTTAECVSMLAERLKQCNSVDVVDMKDNNVEKFEEYDAILLGSSVRMGLASKKIRSFVKNNLDMLSKKPCAVFLCCGFPDEFEDYVKSSFVNTFNPSWGFHCFGGELKPQKARGFDRFLVKAVRKSITEHDFEDGNYEGSLPEIIPEHIYRLADIIMNR